MKDEILAPPTPTFFRFPNEEEGMAALEAAGLLNEDGEFITASHSHCLDVIGVIQLGGAWDPETGEELTPPEVLPGWHVNYQGEVPNGWEQYAVTPESPVRRWF